MLLWKMTAFPNCSLLPKPGGPPQWQQFLHGSPPKLREKTLNPCCGGRSVSPVLRGLKVGEIMSVLRCSLKVRLKKPWGKVGVRSRSSKLWWRWWWCIREFLFSKSGERIRFLKQEVNLTSSSYTHWALIGVGTRIYPMDHSSGKAPVDVENKSRILC